MLVQSRLLRALAIRAYRSVAAANVFYPPPRIFVNTIPKAGTHLLTEILQMLPRVMLRGIHIDPPFLHNGAHPPGVSEAWRIDERKLLKALRAAHGGQIITAHLPYDVMIDDALNALDYANFFMIRDPRDVLVSQMHYIKNLRRHYLHQRLLAEYRTDADRLMACIVGFPDKGRRRGLRSVGESLARMCTWMERDNVLVVRFEDLVGDRGGGAEEAQRRAILSIALHAGRAIEEGDAWGLQARLARSSSFTFRRGVIGDWRNEFGDEHLDAFNRIAGKRLLAMGYASG